MASFSDHPPPLSYYIACFTQAFIYCVSLGNPIELGLTSDLNCDRIGIYSTFLIQILGIQINRLEEIDGSCPVYIKKVDLY